MSRESKGPSRALVSPDIVTPMQASSLNLTLSSQAIIDFFSLSSAQIANTFVSFLQEMLNSFSTSTNNITGSFTGLSNQIANSFSSGGTGTTGGTYYYY